MTGPRERAWATRRRRYGDRGHRGSYWRGTVSTDPLRQRRQLSRITFYCWSTGLLSEGQIARILAADRVEVRGLCDDGREEFEAAPMDGHWGAEAMRRMRCATIPTEDRQSEPPERDG